MDVKELLRYNGLSLDDVARNLLRSAGLTAKEQAAVMWSPEKRTWIIAQAEDCLAALDDPDWPRL